MGGRRLSGAAGLLSAAVPEENDDQAERVYAARQKRAEAERRAEKARSPFRETPGHQARTAQLTDMYSDCITLCAENKVNEKNSWSLDLIDHMGRMIGDHRGGANENNMTNFQLASSTLDAGVKIYAYRVDSVYTETFRLMGGLNRSGKRDPKEDDKDAASGDEDGESGAPKTTAKPKRKRVANPATLEPNPAALNLKKLEQAFEVDPLFHRTSAKFDAGGARGLLLHNLSVRDGCKLIFDSADSATAGAEAAEGAARGSTLPMQALKTLLPADLLGRHVCAGLGPLTGAPPMPALTGGDESGDDDEPVADEPMQDESLPLDDDDLNAWHASDDAGFGGDDGDPFSEAEADPFSEAEAEARERALQMQAGAFQEGPSFEGWLMDGAAAFLSVEELAAQPQAELTEEAMNNSILEQAQRLLQVGQRWAGPSHWKFSSAVRVPGGAETKRAAGKGAKVPFAIDFSKRAEVAAMLEASVEGQSKAASLRSTMLSDAVLAKASASEHVLPNDCQVDLETLNTLSLKPKVSVRPMHHLKRQPLAPRQAWGGELPSTEGVPPEWDDGCGEEAPDLGDGDWHEAGGADGAGQPASGDLELVAAPTKCEKIQIGYAKVAKQVDIKGLKAGLWALLSESFEEEAKKGAPISFQEVIKRLSTKMPPQQLREVSFAYCFICLLHLANEKGLAIQGNPELTDLEVSA